VGASGICEIIRNVIIYSEIIPLEIICRSIICRKVFDNNYSPDPFVQAIIRVLSHRPMVP